jgi:hypothetical protein
LTFFEVGPRAGDPGGDRLLDLSGRKPDFELCSSAENNGQSRRNPKMSTHRDDLADALDPSSYQRVTTGPDAPGPQSSANDRAPDPVTRDVLRALDINTWVSGLDMSTLESRMEQEIDLAVRNEEERIPAIRETLKQALPKMPRHPRGAGLHVASPQMIRHACETVLFNGLVEACDGTRRLIDTLPITIVNIGVALTTYAEQGNGSTFGQRLYRHEIRQLNPDPQQDLVDFLARRQRRDVAGFEGEDLIAGTDMMARAIMSYAERALLAYRSDRPWRMGHGSPFPHEVFTGAGNPEIPKKGAAVMTELLGVHKRALFIPSDFADRAEKTIASALRPGEYAILFDCRDQIDRLFGAGPEGAYGRLGGPYREARLALEKLRDEVACNVVRGVYKASALSPGQIFYAHVDHAHEAALIALADSVLRDDRGFPNLIDLADSMCRSVFDNSSVAANVTAALSRANAPFAFLTERSSRT